jgi:hypothetical protein
MGFVQDDLKQVNNLIGMIKKSHFKELSGPEALSVALVFQWVGELKSRIESELKAPPVQTPPPPTRTPSPEPKKAKK